MVLDNTDDRTFTTPLLSGNSFLWKNNQTFACGILFKSNITLNHDEQNVTFKQLSWRDLFPQILSSVIAFMLVTQPGIGMVYLNIYLMNNELSDISELSWLSGILVLGTPIGAVAIGVIMDRIGRKNAFLLTCMPLLISWFIASIANPNNMCLIYTSRVFAGIGGGMTSMAVVYVSEIVHSTYRQALLSLNSVFFSIGVLFATAVGSLFNWQTTNMIFFGFTAISAVPLIMFLPESPVWLIKFRADQVYEARSSLKRMYPKNEQVFAEEWDRLRYYYMRPSTSQNSSRRQSLVVKLDDLTHFDHGGCRRDRARRLWRNWCSWCNWWSSQPPTVTKPVRLLAVVFLLQQLSGCYTVIVYVVPIFRSVMGTAVVGTAPSQTNTLVALGVVRLLTSVAACVLSAHVGRRPLLVASSLAMSCSAILVAWTCQPAAVDGDYGAGRTPLWPVVGIIAFVCSGSAGVLVFPWTLVGELLPVSVRAVAGALLVSYAYVLMFVALKAFPYLVALKFGGRDGGSLTVAFTVFAAASLTMAAYAYAYLPETLGKQFHEVERCFADDPPRPRDTCNTVSG